MTFNIGDKVVVIVPERNGQIGEVIDAFWEGGWDYQIEFADGYALCFDGDELAPAATQPAAPATAQPATGDEDAAKPSVWDMDTAELRSAVEQLELANESLQAQLQDARARAAALERALRPFAAAADWSYSKVRGRLAVDARDMNDPKATPKYREFILAVGLDSALFLHTDHLDAAKQALEAK